jgi:sulfite reductase beta subunit-like hemoprotein
VALSDCGKDCAFAIAHDFGLVAVRNPLGEPGYRFLAGGGLGRHPHRAKEMESFVPEKEAGSLLISAIGAFQKLGVGRQRAKARLKFLLDEIGIEPFRKEARENPGEVLPESQPLQENWNDAAQELSTGGNEDFLRWKNANVLSTVYPGRFSVTVQVPGGWLTGEQLNQIAEIVDFYSNGRFKLTSEQNILFPALSGAALGSVFQKLTAAGLAGNGVGRISDFTACPGKDHCRGSEGYSLASEIEGFLREEISHLPEEILKGSVKVSGCLNQCGRTGLASFGLAGDWWLEAEGPRRIAHLFLGGGVYEKGSRLARYAGWVHADQLGQFLKDFFEDFRTRRQDGETFKDYCLRVSEDTSRSWAKEVVRMDKLSDQAGFQFEGEC